MTKTDRQFERILKIFNNGIIRIDRLSESSRTLIDEWVDHIHDQEIVESYIQAFCIEEHQPLKEMVAHIEKIIITWSLLKYHGNQSRAARMLGIDYSTLTKKMQKHGIIASQEQHSD